MPKFFRAVRDGSSPEGGQSNTATSEAKPHARRSEAEPALYTAAADVGPRQLSRASCAVVLRT